jgi:hypothetical protein
VPRARKKLEMLDAHLMYLFGLFVVSLGADGVSSCLRTEQQTTSGTYRST